MQEHLKIRLTGAIILVIVVVMLVPEMFRGRPSGGAAHGGAMVDELPLHSYTMDLRSNSPSQSGATVGMPGQVAASVPPVTAVTTPASTAVTAPPVAVPPVATPAAAPTPAAAIGAPSGLRWTVQVGTFSRRDFAEQMVKQVRARGFTVLVAGPDERGLYRVRSAPLNTRTSAEGLRQKMAAQGLKPIVNTTP